MDVSGTYLWDTTLVVPGMDMEKSSTPPRKGGEEGLFFNVTAFRIRGDSMDRFLLKVFAFFFAFSLFLTPAARSQGSGVLVIEGGTLIDGNGGEPVRDALVIIRGNRIETVSQKGEASYPAGARVLQADGKYILPGLMDAHVHYSDWMAELMLNHGVTSVFEIGGGRGVGICPARSD